MLPVEFEHTVSAGERPHTHALARAASGTDYLAYGNSGFIRWSNKQQILNNSEQTDHGVLCSD